MMQRYAVEIGAQAEVKALDDPFEAEPSSPNPTRIAGDVMADVAPISVDPIEFVDLGAQRRRIGTRMDESIRRVLDHGRFILGPEVGELERQLAEFTGARHVLSCANGTDALILAIMAKGV